MRDPYTPAQHSTLTTPLTHARPIGPIRRAMRGFLLWLAGVVQGHPVWPYPLDQFFALEDRPGRCYLWTVHPSLTEDEAASIASAFREEFVRKFHREPRALHIVTPDVASLRRLSKADAELIMPWLRSEE